MNEEFDARMRENRYDPSAFELDQLKSRAISQASRGARSRTGRSPRLVTAFLALALMLSGGSAVIASTSGSSSGGQPSASVSQYVLGTRVIGGNALLAAPTGCVARRFVARVRGVNVVKVVFKLDGKTIATLTKPNLGADYTVRINPAKFKIGVHRIVATVIVNDLTITDTTGGSNTVTKQQPPRTFRISFQRCARKLAAPRFTG
jgi:hypothetical protein